MSRRIIPSPEGTAQVAASLVRFGLQVFPVSIFDRVGADGTAERQKQPLVAAWPTAAANADQGLVWEWWEMFPEAWIGLYCGGSGIVAVDLDRKHKKDGFAALATEGLSLPETLHYTTAGGVGQHHLYRAPAGLWTIGQDVPGPSGKPMPGVDVRAGNGFVVYCGPRLTEPVTLADAPGFALLPLQGRPIDRHGVDVAAWTAGLADGPMAPRVVEALGAVRPEGMSHQDLLAATLALVRLGSGGAGGVRTALDVGRSVYVTGHDATRYGRAWDDAVAGAVALLQDQPSTDFDFQPHEETRPRSDIEPGALARYDATALRWLGADFDLQAAHAVLATAAVEQLAGEPVWLLTVSGSGNAKTETLKGLSAAGAHVISTISGEGALLSGTSRKEQAANATGGLLRSVGHRGILAIKDVTSILSMQRERRAEVLAALREVYDGRWVRHLGTDGGTTLEWSGRLVVVGAVTSAWDNHHAVVSAMGDRFVLVRPSSRGPGRITAARQVLRNTGHEDQMASEMAAAVGEVLGSVDPGAVEDLTEGEADHLIEAANLITMARTAVQRDYQGNPISADAPEAPTRFTRQLQQVFRGALAIGLERREAFRLAMRCARDSMPPLRLELLDHLALFPESSTTQVNTALDKPRSTVDRELQALQLLGLVTKRESVVPIEGKRPWVWSLARGVDAEVLSPEKSIGEDTSLIYPHTPLLDISGEGLQGHDHLVPHTPHPPRLHPTPPSRQAV